MPSATDSRPIGYFVHDQGRGHARRCAAILHRLPAERRVAVFTSNPSLLPPLPANVELIGIPSLYEPSGPVPPGLNAAGSPPSMHFVPLGWPNIREAMQMFTDWFHRVDPVLFIVDVSAELALLARLCSVPCVKIRQHGSRWDPAHLMAYDSCIGLIAPYDERLEQPDVPPFIRAKTFYSGGLNPAPCSTAISGNPDNRRRIVILSGGGGDGFPVGPLCEGARAVPDAEWIVLGQVRRDEREILPANLQCLGWVNDPPAYIRSADLVIASAGDSTVHEICEAGKPYLCIPEWRYFQEQEMKAAALAALNAAHHLPEWPEDRDAWERAIARAGRIDVPLQRSLVDPQAAHRIAAHIESLVAGLWIGARQQYAGRR